jgi:hypothetical protein
MRCGRGGSGRTYKAVVLSADLSDDAEGTLTLGVSASCRSLNDVQDGIPILVRTSYFSASVSAIVLGG